MKNLKEKKMRHNLNQWYKLILQNSSSMPVIEGKKWKYPSRIISHKILEPQEKSWIGINQKKNIKDHRVKLKDHKETKKEVSMQGRLNGQCKSKTWIFVFSTFLKMNLTLSNNIFVYPEESESWAFSYQKSDHKSSN